MIHIVSLGGYVSRRFIDASGTSQQTPSGGIRHASERVDALVVRQVFEMSSSRRRTFRAISAIGATIASATIGAHLTMAQDGAPPSAHPGDGVPDPEGRIAFGRIVQMDDFYGQVVALYAIDPDGSDLLQLNDGESGFPAWSPDGTRLAFTQRQPDGSWQIATMAADGSDVRVLTSGPGADGATWAPDGSWIGYNQSVVPPSEEAFADGSFRTVLYRMEPDGSDPQLLGNPDTFDVEPRISPDGTGVLFERLSFEDGGQQSVLWIRDLASGEEAAITTAGQAVEHANWSPDGEWIIYDVASWMTSAVVNDRLERVASDGSGEPIVILEGTPTQAWFKPWYSPDGDRILVGCLGERGDDAACLVKADGSDVRVLIDESGVHENHFSWGIAAP